MGMLIEGQWSEKGYETEKHGGRFLRDASLLRNWVTADGAPGPSGEGGFRAEKGRYRLYVSLACPWAHRTLIMRALKGLEDAIDVSVVHWRMREGGWNFHEGPGVIADPEIDAEFMHQIYTLAKPDYSGRVTVPVLWDKERRMIVSNESSEIIRMLGAAFDGIGAREGDYYPQTLRAEIDAVNERVYDTVNNGVYKSGFASSQEAYEEAVKPLIESLDWLENRLTNQRYLLGASMTEADIRLFTTLIRFDPVYHGHFKCNWRRIADYPALWAYTRDLYQTPGVAGTVNLDHIKRHYYQSHPGVNPTGVVPIGPDWDLDAPHEREALA